MIYLIDDKKVRQEKDFAWNSSTFELYSDVLTPIYTLDELTDKSTEIFKDNNIVLYHESFIDNSEISSQSAIKRNKLDEFANSNPTFKLVIFSGSKNFRSIISNVAHLPVSILYQNIKLFTERYKAGDLNLNYLAFGENPEVENLLIEKLENSLSEIEEYPAIIPNQKNLFVSTSERYIENPIANSNEVTFFGEESDEDISNFIDEFFNGEIYDNIFIPLCFGKTLSDYNGLRLTAFIRCTESRNRFSRIFIYGFVGHKYLLSNKYFNILKTKNVELISFSKKAFEKAALSKISLFDVSELSTEIKKLNLEIPANYQDNHSIANEWAIYRWAKAIEAEDEAINKIISRVEHQLYFKYLLTKYPVSEIEKLTEYQLRVGEKIKSKVLYIDDEADKGWYEILCKIIYDINGFEFDFLGDELKSKTKDEIIESSISKVIDMDADIVILDFRLHDADFEISKIDDVTGYKILQRIKEFNPGIQVIIFSATNKIWNLLELQQAGADGFILKESPENSVDRNFTKDSIDKIFFSLNESLKKSYLKSIFGKLTPIITVFEKLIRLETKSYVKKDLKFSQEKIREFLEFGKSSFSLLYSHPYDLKYSYLQLILIIEDIIKTFYIDDDNKNHIVELSLFETVLVLERNDSLISMKLKPTRRWTKFIEEDFIINETDNDFKNLNISADRALFNYRLFCVLFYKYNMELSKIEKFASLYNKRSRLSHSGSEEKITKGDIINACELISILTEINKL